METTIEKTTKRLAIRPSTHARLQELAEISGYTFDELLTVMIDKVKDNDTTLIETGVKLRLEKQSAR